MTAEDYAKKVMYLIHDCCEEPETNYSIVKKLVVDLFKDALNQSPTEESEGDNE